MINIKIKPNVHNSMDHDVKIMIHGKDMTYHSLSLDEIKSLGDRLIALSLELYKYSIKDDEE